MSCFTYEEKCLSAAEMAEYRHQAEKTFHELSQQAHLTSSPSWIRQDADDTWLKERSEACRFFDTHGFLVIPQFADVSQVQSLKDQMRDLANNHWDPQSSLDTFGTDSVSNIRRGDYFLDSSNRVHFFAEPTALEIQGDQQQRQLKPEFLHDKMAALNKAGHGMHTIPGSFQEYTLSQKMRDLVTELGWRDPVIPQSMYIFKQARIGGTVHSHHDSTFLFTEPRQTCLGLWLALDDATLDNGCLWVTPGSHREPLRRQFIQNPEYFDESDTSAPKLIFRVHYEDSNVTWEGKLPESLTETNFIPVEVKAGDLVIFCGTLDHLSLPNFSPNPRHTFQLHLVEGPNAGIQWSPENWLQYPSGTPFVRLLDAQENR